MTSPHLPIVGPLRAPAMAPPTREGLLRSLLFFRWATVAWAIVAFGWEVYRRIELESVIDPKPDVAHPWAGAAVLAVMVGVTAALSVDYRRDARRLLRPDRVLPEIAVAAGALALDSWVYGTDHGMMLPSLWPVGAVVAVAIAAGTRPAVVTGIGLGAARYLGWLVAPEPETYNTPLSMARFATVVTLALGGLVAGRLADRLAEGDRRIAAFRAREEVASTLHDGVLQTLAAFQRRSSDDELRTLARSTETELRAYLFGDSPEADDLASRLRAAAWRTEELFGPTVEVVIAPDLGVVTGRRAEVLGAAATEALNNAGKHSGAGTVTVYVEPSWDDDEMVVVSIKDDGSGFDPATVALGQGLDGSIRRRVVEAGGTVRIDGRPGRGAEVVLEL